MHALTLDITKRLGQSAAEVRLRDALAGSGQRTLVCLAQRIAKGKLSPFLGTLPTLLLVLLERLAAGPAPSW